MRAWPRGWRSATLHEVIWVRAATGWAAAFGACGLLLGWLGDVDEPGGFALSGAFVGAAFGLFHRYRDRADQREDASLEMAVRDPSTTDAAESWIRSLRNGEEVSLRWNLATLTPEGVRWSGLFRHSIRWDDVTRVEPRVISVRGIRATRSVYLWTGQARRPRIVTCSKRNFDDVLATCVAMADATDDS